MQHAHGKLAQCKDNLCNNPKAFMEKLVADETAWQKGEVPKSHFCHDAVNSDSGKMEVTTVDLFYWMDKAYDGSIGGGKAADHHRALSMDEGIVHTAPQVTPDPPIERGFLPFLSDVSRRLAADGHAGGGNGQCTEYAKAHTTHHRRLDDQVEGSPTVEPGSHWNKNWKTRFAKMFVLDAPRAARRMLQTAKEVRFESSYK